MPATSFELISQALSTGGPAAAFQSLQQTLRDRKEWHNLFDAMMLQKKFELGLPLARPASLQDVPEPLRKQVEAAYVAAAREVAAGFLVDHDIFSAWMYLKVIREPGPIAEALARLPDEMDDYELLDRYIRIALHEGVHPEKGLRWVLQGNGLCNSITSLDQVLGQLSAEQRSDCARLLVRTLYDELTASVRRQVERRMPMLPPDLTLEKLLVGRDWLFEGGSYHVDVSHLSSVVRFARSITAPAGEIALARQLALYGSRLDRSLQYGGEPPFLDYYPAHLHFFDILSGRNVDAGLDYFRRQLEQEPDEQDKPLLAYVLVDLLIRAQRLEEAVDVASRYLTSLDEEISVSFDELCEQAGRLDVLQQVRQDQGHLVGFTSALIRNQVSKTPPPQGK